MAWALHLIRRLMSRSEGPRLASTAWVLITTLALAKIFAALIHGSAWDPSSMVPSNNCLVRLIQAENASAEGIRRWRWSTTPNDMLILSHPYMLRHPATAPVTRRHRSTPRVLASHPIYRAACKHCSTTTNSGQRHCSNLVRYATVSALKAAKRPQYAPILAGFD